MESKYPILKNAINFKGGRGCYKPPPNFCMTVMLNNKKWESICIHSEDFQAVKDYITNKPDFNRTREPE